MYSYGRVTGGPFCKIGIKLFLVCSKSRDRFYYICTQAELYDTITPYVDRSRRFQCKIGF